MWVGGWSGGVGSCASPRGMPKGFYATALSRKGTIYAKFAVHDDD